MADQDFDYAAYIELPSKVNQVKLLSDPTEKSIHYFFEILTATQNLREEIAGVAYKGMWNKTRCETKVAEAQYDYEKKRDQLLATTTFSAAMRSQELRLAHIHQEMLLELEALHSANMALLKAETFHKMFVHCNSVLNAKSDSIEKQIQVLQMTMYLDPSLRAEMKTKGGVTT